MSNVKAGYSTTMLRVASIEESIRFYELLGFETIDTHGTNPATWARLHCEGGAIMCLRGDQPSVSPPNRIEIYVYTPDLQALRSQLCAEGAKVTPIDYPEYMPGGEAITSDPDGNVIYMGHWGKSEQEAWEKRISARRPRGAPPPIR